MKHYYVKPSLIILFCSSFIIANAQTPVRTQMVDVGCVTKLVECQTKTWVATSNGDATKPASDFVQACLKEWVDNSTCQRAVYIADEMDKILSVQQRALELALQKQEKRARVREQTLCTQIASDPSKCPPKTPDADKPAPVTGAK